MNDHELMTIEEVAKLLRVSERTVYDWAQKGEIPCGKFGTSWRFKRSEVMKWIDQRLGATKQPVLTGTLSLKDVLDIDRVVFLEERNKEGVLSRLADILSGDRRVHNREELLAEVFRREELMSTGIGLGIGVPHVRLNSVDDIVMAVGVCRHPVEDYESLDGEPVRIICMIAAHIDQHAKHIKLLSAVSKTLRNADIRERILFAKTEQEIFDLFTGNSDA